MSAKARGSSIPPSTRKTSRPLELVHIDISGSVQDSLKNFRYIVAFLDDFTAKMDVYRLKIRAELFDALFEYKARSENELQKQRHCLTSIRLDHGGKNLSTAVDELCRNHGIGLEPSPAYVKQSNGVAEILILEHWTRTRVLSFASNLPKYLWTEGIIHGNWLRNRLPANQINADIP